MNREPIASPAAVVGLFVAAIAGLVSGDLTPAVFAGLAAYLITDRFDR